MRGLLAILFVLAPAWATAGYMELHKDGFTSGDIKYLENQLQDFVARGDFKVTLDLDSEGGDLFELLGRKSFEDGLAYRIEDLKLAGLQLTTRVKRRSVCESACTILFALGDTRVASKKSQFMFHAVLVQKAGRRKKVLQKIYSDRWLRVIHSVDQSLAKYLDDEGWLLRRKRNWEVSAGRLRSRFGNYVSYLH